MKNKNENNNIHFTPLYGIDPNKESYCCSLLEINNIFILLDCGWDDTFDLSIIDEPLKKIVHKVDLVLISHPDMAHLGALPYLIGKLKLKAPVYGTLPVHRMGQITMYDAYQAKLSQNPNQTKMSFDLDDVDLMFEHFKQLKYQEKLTIHPKNRNSNIETTNDNDKFENITVTPHPAGHLIGGSIWHIQRESDEVVYAVNYNHRGEHVVGKAAIENFLHPTLLITDAQNYFHEQPKLKDRDSQLMSSVIKTLRKNGNVLIPCDSAGRILELLRVLDQYWIQNKLMDPVVLFNDMSYYVPLAAQSMLEFCTQKIAKNFHVGKNNPFQLTHVSLVHTLQDLDRLPSPKVVLATSFSLESGFARELFMKYASDSKNLILFPLRPPPKTLAHQILRLYKNYQNNNSEDETNHNHIAKKQKKNSNNGIKNKLVVNIQKNEKILLKGAELAAYLSFEKEKKNFLLEKKIKKKNERKLKKLLKKSSHINSSNNDNDIESDQSDDAAAILSTDSETDSNFEDEEEDDEFLNGLNERNLDEDNDSSTKVAVTSAPMFLDNFEKKYWDAYGERINPEDFRDAKMSHQNLLIDVATTEGNIEDNNELMLPDEARPVKIISKLIAVEINAKIEEIDFQGLADRRAIFTALMTVIPRNLVLILGSQNAKKKITKFIRDSYNNKSSLFTKKVFTPEKMEEITVHSEKKINKIRIKDNLYSNLQFHRIDGKSVAYAEGELSFSSEMKSPVLSSKSMTNEGKDDCTNRVFLAENNWKIENLRLIIEKNGFSAEFRSGMIIVNNEIIIKKKTKNLTNTINDIVLEGVLSSNYYTIRQLLYEQFTLV